jgi:hypothetical protein
VVIFPILWIFPVLKVVLLLLFKGICPIYFFVLAVRDQFVLRSFRLLKQMVNIQLGVSLSTGHKKLAHDCPI